MSDVELVMYTRIGCHLCEDMKTALAELAPELGAVIATRDVDTRPEWAERFGRLVPVLYLGDSEVCRYELDLVALRAALAGHRARTDA